MSWKYLFFVLTLPLVGCTPKDPVWEMPCEDRPAREVIPGTGEDQFVPLDQGPIPIEYGDQGGSHLWFSVRLRGFGPDAAIQLAVIDADDPAVVYSGPLLRAAKLEYNPNVERSEARGLFALLEAYDDARMKPRPSPAGKKVLFMADVTDECTPEPVHGESAGEVE